MKRIKYDADTDEYPETMTREGVTFAQGETLEVEDSVAEVCLDYPYFREVKRGRKPKAKDDDTERTRDKDTPEAG